MLITIGDFKKIKNLIFWIVTSVSARDYTVICTIFPCVQLSTDLQMSHCPLELNCTHLQCMYVQEILLLFPTHIQTQMYVVLFAIKIDKWLSKRICFFALRASLYSKVLF